MIHIAYPIMFLLLLLPFAVRYFLPTLKGMHGDALHVPFLKDLANINLKSGSVWGQVNISDSQKLSLRFWELFVVFFLLVLALSRPQWVGEPIRIHSQSRDILLVMDISNSMAEPDFVINRRAVSRLNAVKKVAGEFIDRRANDRIGLILFGTRAYLQSPITYDKAAVKQILYSMQEGMAGNSTAIGDALGLALKSLKDSKNAEDKIIILLTDGENNDGSITLPILLTDGENNDGSITLPQAVKLAKDAGVKIYTIGVGGDRRDFASFFGLRLGGEVDEAGLKQVADDTSGTYFRARDTESLQKVYEAIDELEPTQNEDSFVQETKEFYYIPLLAALILGMFLVWQIRKGR